ncbi:MAG: hypothetical protein L0G69_04660 [Brevibacterium sp.]|uniref:hypothetical protein n=1 Tax=Brevibacterium sandarakinum TaxID=629680 RepID=UPI002654ADA1|nr:hypothetical protein [Brevibacterium sandarakinum]MDN5585838.1 hypothetical protein [Brevibacterium sp.]MDN5656349.1 hypothetical protein [Brevibacterium sandarakinum]
MPLLFRQVCRGRKWRRVKVMQSASKGIEDHELVIEITEFRPSEVLAGVLG